MGADKHPDKVCVQVMVAHCGTHPCSSCRPLRSPLTSGLCCLVISNSAWTLHGAEFSSLPSDRKPVLLQIGVFVCLFVRF